MRAENELQQLLDAVAVESGSKVARKTDEFGFEWLVVRDGDFEDLVTTVHLVASELESRGFGPQLLAAVFPFEGKGFDGGRVYWIYGFKRGAFWPFVPKGDGKERDNAEELELKAKLALRAAGAKVVERDQAPELHDMIERLCAMADLRKPRVAIIEATSPTPSRPAATRSTRRRRHDRALEPARAEGGRGRARARALAHRQPRRARDDRGQLLRDVAALLTRVGLYSGMFGGMGGNRDNNNSVPSG